MYNQFCAGSVLMYGVTSEGLRSLRISFIVLTAQRLLLVTILTGGVTLCVGALTHRHSHYLSEKIILPM